MTCPHERRTAIPPLKIREVSSLHGNVRTSTCIPFSLRPERENRSNRNRNRPQTPRKRKCNIGFHIANVTYYAGGPVHGSLRSYVKAGGFDQRARGSERRPPSVLMHQATEVSHVVSRPKPRRQALNQRLGREHIVPVARQCITADKVTSRHPDDVVLTTRPHPLLVLLEPFQHPLRLDGRKAAAAIEAKVEQGLA